MPPSPSEIVWHNDNHVMCLSLTKSEVSISLVMCPHEGDVSAPCHNERVGCVVRWFLMAYGLDCHVGVAAPYPEMSIAWTLIGDSYDIESRQVWVISVDDMLFSAWAASQGITP